MQKNYLAENEVFHKYRHLVAMFLTFRYEREDSDNRVDGHYAYCVGGTPKPNAKSFHNCKLHNALLMF